MSFFKKKHKLEEKHELEEIEEIKSNIKESDENYNDEIKRLQNRIYKLERMMKHFYCKDDIWFDLAWENKNVKGSSFYKEYYGVIPQNQCCVLYIYKGLNEYSIILNEYFMKYRLVDKDSCELSIEGDLIKFVANVKPYPHIDEKGYRVCYLIDYKEGKYIIQSKTEIDE